MTDKETEELIAVMDRVHRGELSFEAAEAWAKHAGRPPFVSPERASTRIFDAAHWAFFLGVAWVLERGPDAALDAFVRHQVWGRALERQAPWNAAVQELHNALSAGRLIATGLESNSKERVEIPQIKWIDFVWERWGRADFPTFRHDRQPAYHDVRLPAAKLREIWAPHGARTRAVKSSAAQETECVRQLADLMREHPNDPVSKAKLRAGYPTLPKRAFDRAFTNAVSSAETPAWGASGRRKSPRS